MAGNNGSTISQQELEAWLWEAANILRGPVDPANLRDFVFPLLFLRRLSDAWNEEHELAVEAFGEDVDDEVAADFHKFDIPDGCHWNDLRRVGENHGIELLQIMQRIEAANPDKLAQIFGNAPWADPDKMPPERLETLIIEMNRRPKQRTTLYGTPPKERIDASFNAPSLRPELSTLASRYERGSSNIIEGVQPRLSASST